MDSVIQTGDMLCSCQFGHVSFSVFSPLTLDPKVDQEKWWGSTEKPWPENTPVTSGVISVNMALFNLIWSSRTNWTGLFCALLIGFAGPIQAQLMGTGTKDVAEIAFLSMRINGTVSNAVISHEARLNSVHFQHFCWIILCYVLVDVIVAILEYQAHLSIGTGTLEANLKQAIIHKWLKLVPESREGHSLQEFISTGATGAMMDLCVPDAIKTAYDSVFAFTKYMTTFFAGIGIMVVTSKNINTDIIMLISVAFFFQLTLPFPIFLRRLSTSLDLMGMKYKWSIHASAMCQEMLTETRLSYDRTLPNPNPNPH